MKIITITTNGFAQAFDSWPERIEARGLKQHGHDLKAYTYRGNRDFNSQPYEEIDGIEVRRLRRRQFFAPGLVKALLWGERPDLVHLHHWSGQFNYLATLLCKLRGVPILLTTYGLFHDRYLIPDRDRPYNTLPHYDELIYDFQGVWQAWRGGKGIKYALRNYFTHSPYRLVDRMIVLSEHERGVAQKLGVKPDRIAVVPVSIDPDWLDNATPALKIAPQQLLYLGQLKYRKGFDVLAHALPKVFARFPAARCIIATHSPIHLPDLLKILEENGARDRVIIRDDVSDTEKASLFLASDAYILPTRYESFGIPLIEAMSAGCAVVSSDIPVIGELIRDGENGLLAPLDDAEGLADAIIRLLENPELQQQVVAGGRHTVQNYYTPTVIARLEKVYQAVIAERKLFATSSKRLAYVAYPSSMVLKSANAIQTFSTNRELRRLAPDIVLLLPKLPGRPSRFKELGAHHLLRLPFNFLANFKPLDSIPWGYVERTWFAVEAACYLTALRLLGRGCQAIYVRDVICAYWLTRWQKLVGAKIIYEAHDLEARNPSRAKNKGLLSWLQKVDRTVLSQADVVVSLTEAFRDFLVAEGLRAADRPVVVIPDAFDDKIFYQLSPAASRHELGLPADQFIIVYAGTTFAYRSLDKLVTAFDQFLKETGVKAQLYFVGGRDFEVAALRKLVAEAGLSEQVHLTGQVAQTQVNLYLNAASLTAIPDTVTDITASPLKLFEYAAAGRPILLPDLPALREILSEDAAIYFERGNSAAMSAALKWAWRHPDEANQRGDQAAQTIARYTYANRAQAILDLLI